MKLGTDVIVVNYRTPWDLEGFLESYKATIGGWGVALTVVNVSPNDEDRVIADRYGDITANYIEFEDNVGYGRAVNRAATMCDHEVLAIFNADTRLGEGLVSECSDALMANDEWGVLGPRQVDDHKRLVHAGIVGPDNAPYLRAWFETDRGQHVDIDETVPSVSGSAYFIKRSVWDELRSCPLYLDVAPDAEGAFLPTTHFYEETACSYHARAHGFRCVYYGAQTMLHRWHKASPVNEWAEDQIQGSQAFFRTFCDAHGIAHD